MKGRVVNKRLVFAFPPPCATVGKQGAEMVEFPGDNKERWSWARPARSAQGMERSRVLGAAVLSSPGLGSGQGCPVPGRKGAAVVRQRH